MHTKFESGPMVLGAKFLNTMHTGELVYDKSCSLSIRCLSLNHRMALFSIQQYCVLQTQNCKALTLDNTLWVQPVNMTQSGYGTHTGSALVVEVSSDAGGAMRLWCSALRVYIRGWPCVSLITRTQRVNCVWIFG